MKLLLFIKFSVPLSKIPQTRSQIGARFVAEITLQCTGICIGYRHITWLHRDKLLVNLEVVIFRQHLCTNQFFRKDLHEIKQVLRVLIADVVNGIRRNRQTILTILAVRCFLHHTDYALNNIVHISKVSLAVAIVKDLDGLALHQLVGETKIGHVWATCRTIDREKVQTSG